MTMISQQRTGGFKVNIKIKFPCSCVVQKKVSQDVSPIEESLGEPLTELLGESGDINQADSSGRTVLHTLAADGNASLLELALAACPQVN